VNIKNAKKFSVFQKDTISLAVGDTIRITRNGKTAGDILGFLPDRRSPLRNGKQIFREIIESLYNSEKQFRPNQRRLNNGSLYRVIKILPISGDIVLNNGWVLPKNFGHIVHGYCSTSHGSQSKTLDRIIVAQTSMSFGMASNQEQILVSVSRGRERCSIFTDNESELLAEVKKSGARLSASELVRDGEEEMRESARLAREQKTREQESEHTREESRDYER
jgi:hypothetical protein